MIIKSMSRKSPTFAQLVDYIGRSSGSDAEAAFVRNLYSDGRNHDDVAAQFLDNYRYLPSRKGGNALYHELVALEPQPHLTKAEIEAALYELAERYCRQRAPHQLAWGRVHHDTDFPHIHLMISANAVRSDRRVRMDRAYFARVQRDLERWQEEHLPEIKGHTVYGRQTERENPRQPIQEGEMVRRTKSPSRKQQVFETVREIFAGASNQRQAEQRLQAAGFELYLRGQTWSIRDMASGRRYRLRTLGLQPSFERLLARTQHTTEPQVDSRAAGLLAERAAQVIERFDRDDR